MRRVENCRRLPCALRMIQVVYTVSGPGRVCAAAVPPCLGLVSHLLHCTGLFTSNYCTVVSAYAPSVVKCCNTIFTTWVSSNWSSYWWWSIGKKNWNYKKKTGVHSAWRKQESVWEFATLYKELYVHRPWHGLCPVYRALVDTKA